MTQQQHTWSCLVRHVRDGRAEEHFVTVRATEAGYHDLARWQACREMNALYRERGQPEREWRLSEAVLLHARRMPEVAIDRAPAIP